MTRRADEAKVAKDIACLRDLRRQAAELGMVGAAKALEHRQQLCAAAQDRLSQDQDAWAASMTRTPMDIRLAGAWRACVIRSQTCLNQTQVDMASAASAKAEAQDCWSQASLRFEHAKDLARTTASRSQRAAEDFKLAELTDRRGAPWPFL